MCDGILNDVMVYIGNALRHIRPVDMRIGINRLIIEIWK